MKRGLIILYIVGVSLFGTYVFFYAGPKSHEKAYADYVHFYQSTLAGKIHYLKNEQSGVRFKLTNHTEWFKFIPYSNTETNEAIRFKKIAQKGDSIIKAPFSDTLILGSNGRKYTFGFMKFSPE